MRVEVSDKRQSKQQVYHPLLYLHRNLSLIITGSRFHQHHLRSPFCALHFLRFCPPKVTLGFRHDSPSTRLHPSTRCPFTPLTSCKRAHIGRSREQGVWGGRWKRAESMEGTDGGSDKNLPIEILFCRQRRSLLAVRGRSPDGAGWGCVQTSLCPPSNGHTV